MNKGCMMKKMASDPRSPLSRPLAPQYQPHGPCVRPTRMAGPVQSITRAEIDHFWRKKLEEEEHQLAAEKEAARIKVKSLKQEEYMLFEQRINEIIDKKNERDKMMEEGDITKNSKEDAVVTRNIEIRIGIKNWWRQSRYAYLNEPVVTYMDENSKLEGYHFIYSTKDIFWVLLTSTLPDKHYCLWDLLSADTKNDANHTNAFCL